MVEPQLGGNGVNVGMAEVEIRVIEKEGKEVPRMKGKDDGDGVGVDREGDGYVEKELKKGKGCYGYTVKKGIVEERKMGHWLGCERNERDTELRRCCRGTKVCTNGR